MRNFSYSFGASSVFSVSVKTRFQTILDELWVRFGNSLPYDPDRLTPSEREVVDAITGWLETHSLQEKSWLPGFSANPMFTYVNLNTGKAVLFFWNSGFSEYSNEVCSCKVLT